MTKRPAKVPKWLAAARAAGSARSASERPDWLSRALARAGVMTPSEVEAALGSGRIRVGDVVVRDPLTPICSAMKVFVDGAEIQLASTAIVLAFHKPDGVVSAGDDPEGVGTVFSALGRALREEHQHFGWHAVGRLDRHTTGLLLFTNDERLVEHVTDPQTKLSKRYVANVNGGATTQKLQPLCEGITLDDGPTRPALARISAPGVVELTITEGRHHQVKRMLSAVGLPVTKLHRESIGSVSCDVAVGQYRVLTATELREGLGFNAEES